LVNHIKKNIGILALQGGFAAHGKVLDHLQIPWQLVRNPHQLDNIDALILPGGESTTLLKFIQPFILKLNKFNSEKKPILTTCAGTILLAKHVIEPEQKSLGLLNITVQRNAYGRQTDSFIANDSDNIEMTFIRAPKILKVLSNIKILAKYKDDPVLIQQDNILAATFHPELSNDNKYPIHLRFLEILKKKSKIK
jgi:pyridoxal 5'-phosphate synthase pdxT subunit